MMKMGSILSESKIFHLEYENYDNACIRCRCEKQITQLIRNNLMNCKTLLLTINIAFYSTNRTYHLNNLVLAEKDDALIQLIFLSNSFFAYGEKQLAFH